MSKRLILILALMFAVGFCTAAYAEVQNVKVSGDLLIKGVNRGSLTLRDNDSTADFSENINAILSTVRLRVDADLTDNVSTTVRLLNERVWGDEADNGNNTAKANNSDIALDLGYVTLKEFLYSPLTLCVGRQELRFGNGLVIGDPDTNAVAEGHLTNSRYLPNSLDDLSLRKAFDAVRATLDYEPLVIDLVYAKIDEDVVSTSDDTDLCGINAAYTVNQNLLTEAYLWQRNRSGIPNTSDLSDTEKLRTLGARAVYTGIKDLTLGLEGAFQFGDHLVSTTLYPDEVANNNTHRKVTAYAIQAVANYALPDVRYSPVIGASYTYLSGDKYLSSSDNYRGWNPMFEDQAGGTLFNKILGYTNAQFFNLNGTITPVEDVKLVLNYYYLRLNQPFTSSATAVTLTGIASDPTSSDPTYRMDGGKKDLGNEIDVDLTYDYTEDVQFGLNFARFIPGKAFARENDKSATQVIGSMKVTF
jgi:hypothetical protein